MLHTQLPLQSSSSSTVGDQSQNILQGAFKTQNSASLHMKRFATVHSAV